MFSNRQGSFIVRHGIITVETVADLRAHPFATSPDLVFRTLGALTAGDGGGGTWPWDASSTDDDDTATVVLPTGHVDAGRRRRDGDLTRVHVAWWGGHPSRTGAQNSAALDAAMTLLADDGGVIQFGAGIYFLSPNYEYPISAFGKTIKIIGTGSGTVWTLDNPDPDDWIGIFGNQDRSPAISLDIDGIRLQPQNGTTFTQMNGLRIRSTNNAHINCEARFIEGTAFSVEGETNGEFNLVTYGCGRETPRQHSVIFTSNSDGFICNDLIVAGTTESDVYGWRFEDCVLLRSLRSIKVHGSSRCIQALSLYNCQLFDLTVTQTKEFLGTEHLLIADGLSPEVNYGFPKDDLTYTRNDSVGVLRTAILNNVEAIGGAPAPIIALDLQQAQSVVTVRSIFGNDLAGDTRGFEIRGPGSTAIVDLSDMEYPAGTNEANLIVDQRNDPFNITHARTVNSGVTTKLEPSWPRFDVSYPGDVQVCRALGAADSPDITALTINDNKADRANSSLIVPPVMTISSKLPGQAAGDAYLLGPTFLFYQEPAEGLATQAILKSVTVSCFGLPDVTDPANYWTVLLYRDGGSARSILKLQPDVLSTVEADGLPNYAITGAVGLLAARRKVMVFNKSLNQENAYYIPRHVFALIMAPVGSPPAISDVEAHVQYVLRNMAT